MERKIDLRLRPALETLDDLIAAGQGGRFDFVFIDADKTELRQLFRTSPGVGSRGRIDRDRQCSVVGSVIDPAVQDEDTRAIRAFNEKLHGDERVWLSMLPVRDGLTLACKKA